MEVVLAVGGVFLAPILQVAVQRIAKSREFTNLFIGKKAKQETLDRLHNTLEKIYKVLEDVEDKQKTPAVMTWLGKVKAEANYADDLLDEFNTECLRLKLEKQTQAAPNSYLQSAFINLKLSLKPSLIKLMPKLRKVTATLEDFANQISELRLREWEPTETYAYPAPSSSVVDKVQIFGRADEKEKLIERVLSNGGASNVSVIAITGMGGIGKTTLAQLVYNDDRVKKKFSTRAWVCVSKEYNIVRVMKDLLMEINPDVVNVEDGFNSLQVKLKKKLKCKCFLIILDDIWSENLWNQLKTPLIGRKGSKIIVTTRNEKVACMMQTEPFHHLQQMAEDESWRLFKSQAFDNGYHTHEFERIGKDIVKKCNGLPLAIKLIACALRPQRDFNVWENFLSSDYWAVRGNILPALWLSYKHIPYNLKGCFAYCALFPKDVPFNKDEVVLLWMANDLASTLEVGRAYFEELKSRSFFESVDENLYLMHDLINDLARFVAGNSCIRLEDYQTADHQRSIQRENKLPLELLHFSYLSTPDEQSERFSGLDQAKSLRTFLPINQYRFQCTITTLFFSDIVSRFKSLRALNLSHYEITMVPDSIGDLKHLRLLNLASTDIKKLPNAICKCVNLQTLILANCKELVDLPKDMRLLLNLQHLDVREVGKPFIEKMATWLSIFKDTQRISIVVDTILGSVLEHLDKLQPCHSLNIIALGDNDVVTTEGAKREELKEKRCIENLTLEWGGVAKSPEDELNKLVKLQPHTNTKKLSIRGYTGFIFPNWLGDSSFSNIESLSLQDCHNCFSLPSLGQLTGLKKLEIGGMDGITVIGKEFYGDTSITKPFQALEYLEFRGMAKWEIWNTHSVVFPSLQALCILNCNNILSFAEGGLATPNLKKLTVEHCKKMKSLPARMHKQLPLLTQLRIINCPEIGCFPEGGLPSSLETLNIRDCSKMRIPRTNWWGLRTLPSLKKVELSGFEDTLFPEKGLLPTGLEHLYISGFRNLESLNEKGLQYLSSLQTLSIDDCHNLKCLPQNNFSPSLSEVYISECELVDSFPEGLASSLSQLRINKCPKLAARIEREKGEDWPNVFHIKKIKIL